MDEQNFLIVGAGRSGIDSARLLLSLNKSVTIFDGNTSLDIESVRKKIGFEVSFILGTAEKEQLSAFDVCVTSPGVPLFSNILTRCDEINLPIWSEIELAYRLDKGSVVAITGTNGKTTTTSLCYEIVKKWNENTILVGNIEIPYTGMVPLSKKGGMTVAEISSFQLETMRTVKPRVSAVLNITPDHLDRHKTMECYTDLKLSIAKNQDTNDFCVLNFEDELIMANADKVKCQKVFFSSKRAVSNGVYLDGDDIIVSLFGKKELLLKTGDTNLVGVHNFENIMAAVAITHCLGVPLDIIRSVLKVFTAVEHRIEFVCEKNGVKYYNDSKGTNTDAAIKAIDAMDSKTVLIAGGYDKHSDYTEWVSRFPGKVRLLVLMGQTKELIAKACDAIGFKDYTFVESMEQAVEKCKKAAQSGDCVLLSPACASWGMFKCYQERGTVFKDLVKKETA